MLENVKFDWYSYYKLAKSFENENDSAKLRTGIGRFYYSAFLKSRDHIISEKLFLSKINENIMLSTSGRVHRETRITFKNNEKINKSGKGKKIAQRLNVLRKYRNMVDYDSEKPKNLRYAYDRCQMKSKRIFELLDELC
ncbi:MAG: hypothetical protein IJF83_12855 [Methanobrevibacter sp.]|nr:hypothetical protein [Methanobrevibacter sp.]